MLLSSKDLRIVRRWSAGSVWDWRSVSVCSVDIVSVSWQVTPKFYTDMSCCLTYTSLITSYSISKRVHEDLSRSNVDLESRKIFISCYVCFPSLLLVVLERRPNGTHPLWPLGLSPPVTSLDVVWRVWLLAPDSLLPSPIWLVSTMPLPTLRPAQPFICEHSFKPSWLFLL